MNIFTDDGYALHNLWRGISNKIKFFMLPIVYIILLLALMPHHVVYTSQVVYERLDSYNNLHLTYEDKIEYILDKYNLTKEEFNILRAIVLSEAQSDSYEDAYAVINTIYNRTHSKNWVRSVNSYYGKDKGYSLYYQAISPNQFTVYKSGSYKKNLNNEKSVGNNAIIDFLFTESIMHNYLSFRSHSIKINGSETFSDRGNNYFNEIKEENRI